MRLFLSIVAVFVFGASTALAQSEDWLVLPTTHTDDVSWMEPTVAEVSSALRRQGIGVWSSGQAVVAFEQRGSALPSPIAESTIQAWEARSNAAVRQLALGDYPRALAELEAAQALSQSSLEQLNRDPKRARLVLDTCLYMVRALLETGDAQGARAQARECVRMVPNTEPTRYMHPPRVADLYADAARPGSENLGALLIESEPTGCALRINGIAVGKTPVEMTGLYPGDYRVQLECDITKQGRVHPAQVSGGRTALFIFDRFDQALSTKPTLHLRYEQPATDSEQVRDARQLARALPAAAVVLASADQGATLELRLISGARKDSAFARIATTPSGPDSAAVAQAVATLLSGQCRDLSGERPVILDCGTGKVAVAETTLEREQRAPHARPPRAQFIAGLTLASAGTASLLTGYGLLGARSARGDDWISDPGSLSAHQKWLNVGTGLIATGSAGSAMLVAAMPLALPYEARTPWWAWLSGSLGIGAAVGAIVVGVTADPKPDASCSVNNLNPEPCVNRGKQTDLAITLGATAAPLITMPLVYLLRKDEKMLRAELSPGFHVHRSGGALTVGGVF